MKVAEARALAQELHAGQVDKQGRDYFAGHVEPIALSLTSLGDDAVVAGYLHDVVEDTPETLDSLRARGVSDGVVAGVGSVTRRAGETYEELIGRSCADPLGCLVKERDNWHNIASNPGLARTDPDRAAALLVERYLPARARLLEAIEAHHGAAVRAALPD